MRSPGRMLGALGERLRGIRYAAGDALYAAGRLPRAIASGSARFWGSLPVVARRRLVAALAAAVALLLLLGLAVPNLPCAFPGGESCPPDDEAIELVPADALAYAHVNLDSGTEQYERAAEVLGRTPLLGRQILGSLPPLLLGGGGSPPDFAREVEPWIGGEAAVALLGAGGRRGRQVQLLEVADSEGAGAYAEGIAAGRVEASDYRGVEVSEDARGLASAEVEGFLVLGTTAGVREVIDVATGQEGFEPLGEDEAADEALGALPNERVAEAYLSKEGVEELSAAPQSPLAAAEPLLNAEASRGAAASIGADEHGLVLATRSLLDAERAEANPGFFAAFDEFEPELPDELAPDALAYVGLGEASATAQALLRQATARAPAIAKGFGALTDDLRREAAVDLREDLLPALGGEAAVSVVPRPAPEGPEGASLPGTEPPETVAPGGVPAPFLELLADEVDEGRAREALARLQGPLAKSFDPELGAPTFGTEEIGDVEAQVLRISPTVQLAYALFDGMLAAASDPAGVRRAVEGTDDGLGETELFERATDELPAEPGLLAYLDLGGLLRYAEQTGLAADPAYAALAGDLRRLGALALAVTSGDGELRADARLLVSD